MEVAVLVLGDAGRSPRMQYHSLSLTQQEWVRGVTLVATRGTPCMAALQAAPKLRQALLRPPAARTGAGRARFLLLAPLKVAQQSLQLFWALARIPGLDCVLVQNPPCIPTFAVLLALKLVRGTPVVIDWHNLGFSILGLSFGEHHWLVRVSRAYEVLLGRLLGDGHLCVTNALADWLVAECAIPRDRISVQYDHPPDIFHRRALADQHDFFERLGAAIVGAGDGEDHRRGNLFTRKDAAGEVHSLPDRPLLMVSSTSWTPDEDFGILLAALTQLDEHPLAGRRRLICVVTGKGPQKAMYEAKMAALGLKNVTIRTMWLEPEDYPRLLGAADLGVCLHTSSSGLDLPMKVVDMFGSGLPVCAIAFSCLGELVQDGKNGLVFRTESELAAQLAGLLLEEGGAARLDALRRGADAFAETRWSEHWAARSAPRLRAAASAPRHLAARISLLALLLAAPLGLALLLLSAGP